jgi:tetratricopeptide (TPR) repeat protein
MQRLAPLTLILVACATANAPNQDADVLRRQGRNAEAYDAYARLLCGTSSNLALARRFVETWHLLGQPGRPGARLVGCDIDPPVAWFIDGLEAGTRGDIDAALAAFERAAAVAAPGAQAEIAFREGILALNADRAARAKEHLSRAAGLEPERAEIRIALAQAHVETGELGEANGVLRGLLAIEVTARDLDRARKVFAQALKRAEPPLAETAQRDVNEILAGVEAGQTGPEILQRALALAAEVQHPRVLTAAGLVALDRGLPIEAGKLLREAAELSPLDPEPMRVLGEALYASDRPADALAPLEVAMHRNPFDVEVARMLAAVASAVGSNEVARDTYRALTVLEPVVAAHHLWLARTERKLGNNQIARRAAVAGCELDAKSIPLLMELASIEATLAIKAPTARERDEARRHAHDTVERLLAVAPNHPAAEVILGTLDSQ